MDAESDGKTLPTTYISGPDGSASYSTRSPNPRSHSWDDGRDAAGTKGVRARERVPFPFSVPHFSLFALCVFSHRKITGARACPCTSRQSGRKKGMTDALLRRTECTGCTEASSTSRERPSRCKGGRSTPGDSAGSTRRRSRGGKRRGGRSSERARRLSAFGRGFGGDGEEEEERGRRRRRSPPPSSAARPAATCSTLHDGLSRDGLSRDDVGTRSAVAAS